MIEQEQLPESSGSEDLFTIPFVPKGNPSGKKDPGDGDGELVINDGRRLVDVGNKLTPSADVVAKIVVEIGKDPRIYQYGGKLANLITVENEDCKRKVVSVLPPEQIDSVISKNVVLFRSEFDGEKWNQVVAPLTKKIVSKVATSGTIEGGLADVRRLTSITQSPFVRRDWSIVTQPGYDSATGRYLDSEELNLDIPEAPTREDAERALAVLRDLVSDCRFDDTASESAWLAFLFTLFLRPAIDGYCPVTVVNANQSSSGKTTLLDIAGIIATGSCLRHETYSHDARETKNMLGTFIAEGASAVMLDNVFGAFGNSSLDAAVTSRTIGVRKLHFNETISGPMNIVFCATGNNIRVVADHIRRVNFIQLRAKEERPQEKSDWKFEDIENHVLGCREKYLSAVFTIIRAYHLAGFPKPERPLAKWNSFQKWSVIREMLVWVGMPDPYETRHKLREDADVVNQSAAELMSAWAAVYPDGEGVMCGRVYESLFDIGPERTLSEAEKHLKAVIVEQFGRSGNTAKLLSYRVRDLCDRPINGMMFKRVGRNGSGTKFAVVPSECGPRPEPAAPAEQPPPQPPESAPEYDYSGDVDDDPGRYGFDTDPVAPEVEDQAGFVEESEPLEDSLEAELGKAFRAKGKPLTDAERLRVTKQFIARKAERQSPSAGSASPTRRGQEPAPEPAGDAPWHERARQAYALDPCAVDGTDHSSSSLDPLGIPIGRSGPPRPELGWDEIFQTNAV